jgi:predicted kinase
MSRGALMLDAARTGVELAYAPIAGAARHGARPARIAETRRAAAPAPRSAPLAADAPQVVLLIGLPGAGKSTFYQQRFAATHVHISRDLARRARQPESRQSEHFHEALRSGKSVVVDNTNVSINDRATWISAGRRLGARITLYLFTADARECVARNAGREGAARVPNVGIYAAARRLVRPGYEEGFDELYCVRTLPDLKFEIDPPEEL